MRPGRHRRSVRRRGLTVVVAALPIAAVIAADVSIVVRHDASAGPSAAQPAPTPLPTATAAPQGERNPEAGRAAAIRALLQQRGDAVVHHDRAEWLSTLDPKQPKFRDEQLAVFGNLQQVSFASWSYSFDPDRAQPHVPATRRYGAPVWAPADFALRYRLRGFDAQPTVLPQYPTFVHRSTGWYLGSLTDFASHGMHSSRDLWDNGPVEVVRQPHVLVLGHPESISTMDAVAAEVSDDIPRVTSVWGTNWSQRAVVLVPSTEHELAEVVDDKGNLDHIAAVATAEVNQAGRPNPVGDRIGINPQNWPRLSLLGRRIVLTHELTHVASRAVTSSATPKWLSEGFADYVGYRDSGIPTAFVAQDLALDVRRGAVPKALPDDKQFDSAYAKLSRSYEEAWMACRLIASSWGQHKLVELYRAVGVSNDVSSLAVSEAMHRVLHTSPKKFTAAWQRDLRDELG
jgi:hypothetical protein